MMIPNRWISFGVVPIVFFWAAWCHATQIIPSTLEYMTGFSDAIVIGHVVGKHSYWQDKKIVTSVTVDVEQSLKHADGKAAPSVELIIPGGKVGDIALEIDQAPVFEVGQKVMLFLKKADRGYFPFGFNYGVYQIFWDDAARKEFIAGPLFEQPEHYDLRTMQAVKNPEPLGKRELGVFVKQVEQLVQ
jgi:hypothetical protein